MLKKFLQKVFPSDRSSYTLNAIGYAPFTQKAIDAKLRAVLEPGASRASASYHPSRFPEQRYISIGRQLSPSTPSDVEHECVHFDQDRFNLLSRTVYEPYGSIASARALEAEAYTRENYKLWSDLKDGLLEIDALVSNPTVAMFFMAEHALGQTLATDKASIHQAVTTLKEEVPLPSVEEYLIPACHKLISEPEFLDMITPRCLSNLDHVVRASVSISNMDAQSAALMISTVNATFNDKSYTAKFGIAELQQMYQRNGFSCISSENIETTKNLYKGLFYFTSSEIGQLDQIADQVAAIRPEKLF